jgi:hypothetical protein
MTGMPYHLEKGVMFSAFEDFLNRPHPASGKPPMAVRALRALRDPNRPLTDTILFKSSTVHRSAPPPPPITEQTWIDHLRGHWFGEQKQPEGTWLPAPEPVPGASTGYWIAYAGNVEAIVRETLRRALEVALDVDHDEHVPDEPARHWPIEIFWKCAQGWFEGWVTWRRTGAGRRDGQVTVIVATPGHPGHPVQLSPLAQAGHNTADYELNPPSCTVNGQERQQGKVVVTHRNHLKTGPQTTTVPSKKGDWSPPLLSQICGQGPIVAVSISERDGGVKAVPREWNPGGAP